VKAIISATAWARGMMFAALAGRNLSSLNSFGNQQIKHVHQLSLKAAISFSVW
jgi:hypothetical protein